MNVADALKELRKVLADEAEPFGWSNALLKSFMDEGQIQFCEDTGMFLDASTTFNTKAGTALYALNENVIQVYDVVIAGNILTQKLIPAELRIDNSTGTPTYWDVDSDTGYIRLYPTPDAIYTVSLKVWRGPNTLASVSGVFEIPSRYHRAPIEYAASKAYALQDTEISNPAAENLHNQLYLQYVLNGKRSIDRRASGNSPVGGCSRQYVV